MVDAAWVTFVGEASPSTKIPAGRRVRREPVEIRRSEPGISHRSVPTVMQAGILVAGGTPEERIAAIGTAQHGRLSRWQLLAAGITDSMIRTRVSNGSLIRIRNGVYAVGHTAPMGFAAEVAALLTAPRETLLSHLTAARIWGIHNPASTDPLTIDILVDDGGGRRIDGVREHRTDNPHRLVFAFVHALPLTVPEQTLLDIAPLLTPRELERALDEALTRGLTKRQRMSEAARRDIRRPGSANLRALTPARGPLTLTRSQAEERFLRLIREAGLPAPEINVRLQGFTVDFFWRGAGVVVEIDGYQWHSSRSAFERDRRKDAAIRGAGLVLARFTWEAMERRPLEVVARLAADLAAREGREGREGQKARGQAVFTTS